MKTQPPSKQANREKVANKQHETFTMSEVKVVKRDFSLNMSATFPLPLVNATTLIYLLFCSLFSAPRLSVHYGKCAAVKSAQC